jgi:hypothetical protein
VSTMPTPSPQRSNPIVWLLGSAVVALLALVVVLALNSRGRRGPDADGASDVSDTNDDDAQAVNGKKKGRRPKSHSGEKKPEPELDDDSEPPTPVARSGDKVKRDELTRQPKPPKKIDPDRITAAFQPGKTYEMILKGDAEGKGTNSSWGETVVVYSQFLFECAIDRTIESNDGDTLVELRHYKVVRNAVVDAKVEEVKLDFGWPGQMALTCLESVAPGSYVMFDSLQPFATDFAKNEYQKRLDQNAKVRGTVDSLSGKKVRLTFENGKGVTQVQPLGCDLNSDERDFIFATAVLADCFIMPNFELKAGETWTVDGQNLAGLIDPSLRGDTSGLITVGRRQDATTGSHPAAVLEITQGRVVIDSTTPKQYDIGTFTPRGKLVFDLEDEFVASADLTGTITIENCSRDHILYETSWRTKPEIKVTYTCKIR